MFAGLPDPPHSSDPPRLFRTSATVVTAASPIPWSDEIKRALSAGSERQGHFGYRSAHERREARHAWLARRSRGPETGVSGRLLRWPGVRAGGFRRDVTLADLMQLSYCIWESEQAG